MKKIIAAFYPFRWYALFLALVISLLVYADQTGWRLFTTNAPQQWNASGPGGHK